MALAPAEDLSLRDRFGSTRPDKKRHYYLPNTTNHAPMFADAAGAIPLTQPLISDLEGRFTKDSAGHEFTVPFIAGGWYDRYTPGDKINRTIPVLIVTGNDGGPPTGAIDGSALRGTFPKPLIGDQLTVFVEDFRAGGLSDADVIQAAISYAAGLVGVRSGIGGDYTYLGADVRLGSRVYLLNESIVVPFKAINLSGAGEASTKLIWTTDLGTDVAAIDFLVGTAALTYTPDQTTRRHLRDMTIMGPATNFGPEAAPANGMIGVNWPSHLRLENLRIDRFHKGINECGDHQVATNVCCRANYYGLYIADAEDRPIAGLQGDQLLSGVELTGNYFASIGVGPHQQMVDVMFDRVHLGFNNSANPAAIYCEGAGDAREAILDCNFDHVFCETVGNFISTNDRNIKRTRFGHVKIRKQFDTVNALIEVGGGVIDSCESEHFVIEFGTGATMPPGIIAALGITNCDFGGMESAAALAFFSNVPFVNGFRGGDFYNNIIRSGESEYTLANTFGGGTIARGAVLTLQGYTGTLGQNLYAQRALTDGKPLGVATHDQSGNGWIMMIQTRGLINAATADATIAIGDTVEPVTTGGARKSTGASRHMLGVAVKAPSGGFVLTAVKPTLVHKHGSAHSPGGTDPLDSAAWQARSERGAANGYATLDAGGLLPISQLPSSAMEFKGAWNASTNTPALADGVGNVGDTYKVTAAASRNLGSGAIDFQIGDAVMYDGALWFKVDDTDSVQSVAGRTGAVVLAVADVSGAQAIAQKDVANGYAGLDALGLLQTSVLPPLSITTVQVVASQVAQLALTAQEGDVAVRSDQNKSYIRNSGSAGTMADWTELATPTDAVLSVAGKTGAVSLVAADVDGAFPVGNWRHLMGPFPGSQAGGTGTNIFMLYAGGSLASTSHLAGFGKQYLDPADQAYTGKTTKYRVKATLDVNDTAPGQTFKVGLYAMSAPFGGSGVMRNANALVAGSEVTFTTPAANALLHGETEFTAPAAGYYCLGYVVPGAIAAASFVELSAVLQARDT